MKYMRGFVEMNPNQVYRRRSVSLSDELWHEILLEIKNCMSVSEYIRQAIEEKLKRGI